MTEFDETNFPCRIMEFSAIKNACLSLGDHCDGKKVPSLRALPFRVQRDKIRSYRLPGDLAGCILRNF